MKYTEIMDKIYIDSLKQELKLNPNKLISTQEKIYDEKINNICNTAIEKNKHIILLTGPSSSGKTTTAKKITKQLENLNKKVYRISLDNFYKPGDDFPLWEDGNQNYETIEALDIDYFNEKINELMVEKKSSFPIYEFGKRIRSQRTFEVMYDKQTFLIFEGIHALNPLLSKNIDDKNTLKIYVSLHSDFVDNGDNIILPAKTLRLMRRTLRDSIYRKTDFDETFNLWKYVIKGEDLYIKPFKTSADIHINSTHSYEPFLYCHKIYNLLKDQKNHSTHKELILELLNISPNFEKLDDSLIPKTSLIQEFL